MRIKKHTVVVIHCCVTHRKFITQAHNFLLIIINVGIAHLSLYYVIIEVCISLLCVLFWLGFVFLESSTKFIPFLGLITLDMMLGATIWYRS